MWKDFFKNEHCVIVILKTIRNIISGKEGRKFQFSKISHFNDLICHDIIFLTIYLSAKYIWFF